MQKCPVELRHYCPNTPIYALFEIIGVREDIASIIFASQVPVENWVSCMKNKTLADAIVDRLTHGSIKIELYGDSMRKNKLKK